MKRIGLLILTLVLTIGMVACGGNKTTEPTEGPSEIVSESPTALPTETLIASPTIGATEELTSASPTIDATEKPTEGPVIEACVPDVLELVIDSTGKGSNKVANGPAITTVGDGNVVGVDENTGMRIVTIPKAQTGYYTFPMTETLYKQLMEGYTLEAYFKVSEFDANVGANHHDVLGCEEWDGGFGITNSEQNVLRIRQRVTSWQFIEMEFEYDQSEWIHFVMTYNGSDTVNIYIDGCWENMETQNFNRVELLPSVDFFCIGGNAVPADVSPETSGYGSGLSLGICNIYSWELTEDEVTDLYAAHVESLMK